MRVGITGISGLIGSALAKQLRAGGVEVVGYSRSKRSLDFADEMRPYPELDLRGVDVMVHLAGESVLGFWTEEKKQRILSSRVDGTRAVVDAMRKLDEAERPRGLVCASAIGYYGDRGDELLTETSEPGEGYLADVVRAWEAEAMRAEDDGVRVVRGRIGVVLAAGGGAAPLWKRVFGLGLGGKLGSGKQWVSWVGIRDLLAIFELAIREDLEGAVNFVGPEPVRNEELTRVIGQVLHRPTLIPAPAMALRTALGEMSEMLLHSQRVEPGVLREHAFTWAEQDLQSAVRTAFGGQDPTSGD